MKGWSADTSHAHASAAVSLMVPASPYAATAMGAVDSPKPRRLPGAESAANDKFRTSPKSPAPSTFILPVTTVEPWPIVTRNGPTAIR